MYWTSHGDLRIIRIGAPFFWLGLPVSISFTFRFFFFKLVSSSLNWRKCWTIWPKHRNAQQRHWIWSTKHVDLEIVKGHNSFAIYHEASLCEIQTLGKLLFRKPYRYPWLIISHLICSHGRVRLPQPSLQVKEFVAFALPHSLRSALM